MANSTHEATRGATTPATGSGPDGDDALDERELDEWVAIDGTRMHTALRLLLIPFIDYGYRSRAYGTENIPDHGAFLLCPNHSSYMDPFLQCRPQRRIIRFMGKAQLFEWPVVKWIAKEGGAFPVRRGEGDRFAMELARRILVSGEPVVIYAEGTRFRKSEALGNPKRGAARLALETGVPVIPCASYGAKPARTRGEKPFPRRLPKVTTVYGPPLRFEGLELTPENVDRVRDEIWAEVQRLYDIARDLHAARPKRATIPPRPDAG